LLISLIKGEPFNVAFAGSGVVFLTLWIVFAAHTTRQARDGSPPP
jgi:hypothetical protein